MVVNQDNLSPGNSTRSRMRSFKEALDHVSKRTLFGRRSHKKGKEPQHESKDVPAQQEIVEDPSKCKSRPRLERGIRLFRSSANVMMEPNQTPKQLFRQQPTVENDRGRADLLTKKAAVSCEDSISSCSIHSQSSSSQNPLDDEVSAKVLLVQMMSGGTRRRRESKASTLARDCSGISVSNSSIFSRLTGRSKLTASPTLGSSQKKFRWRTPGMKNRSSNSGTKATTFFSPRTSLLDIDGNKSENKDDKDDICFARDEVQCQENDSADSSFPIKYIFIPSPKPHRHDKVKVNLLQATSHAYMVKSGRDRNRPHYQSQAAVKSCCKN